MLFDLVLGAEHGPLYAGHMHLKNTSALSGFLVTVQIMSYTHLCHPGAR